MLVPTLVVLGSNGMSVITEIHREQWTPASRFIFHGHSRSLDQYFLLVITMSLSCTVSMGDGRRFGMGAKLQRVCGTEVPQQNPGAEPESSRSWIFKVVTSKFYAFLVVFQNFHLYMPMFLFRACRHHSTKSPKWGGGHLIPFAYHCLQLGQLPPLPPAPPPMTVSEKGDNVCKCAYIHCVHEKSNP